MSMNKVKEKRFFTIMIVPHTEGSVFSFRLPFFVFQSLCFLVIASLAFSFMLFKNYQAAEAKLNHFQEIENENYELKGDMDLLAHETEGLKEQLQQMSALSKEIITLTEATVPGQAPSLNEWTLTDQTEDYRILAGRGGNPVLERVNMNISLLQDSIPQQREEMVQLKDDMEEYQKELACTPSIWPVKGRVSSLFGPRRSPITGRQEMHYGLDIAAPRGTPVYASANGKVIEAKYHGSMGNMITINHGYSYKTVYGHLASYAVLAGDAVQKGDLIGYVGRTGRTTGSHLHYEVHIKGVAVNPKDFLS